MNALEEMKKKREEEEKAAEDAVKKQAMESESRLEATKQEIRDEIANFNRLAQSTYRSTSEDLRIMYAHRALASNDASVSIGDSEELRKAEAEEELAYSNYEDQAEGSMAQTMAGYAWSASKDRVKAASYQKSMAKLLKEGHFTREAWEILVQKGSLPSNYLNWYDFLSADRTLADELIQAVKNAQKKVQEGLAAEEKAKKQKNWIIAIVVIGVLVFLISRCFAG